MSHDHRHPHQRLNTVAVHLALLKDGKALLFSGSHEKLWDWTKGESSLWDPDDPHSVRDPKLERNLFCSGHCFLADGRLFVAGGQSTFNYPHVIAGTIPGILPLALKILGRKAADHDIHTFDPIEPDPDSRWRRHFPGMARARWYPTCVTLPDGRALIVSGTWSHGHHAIFGGFMNTDYEVFDPATNKLSEPADFGFDKIKMYPFLQVLPGNRLFVHSEKTARVWDIKKKRFLEGVEFTTKTGGTRTYPGMGSCVLLPLNHDDDHAKILLVGGSMAMKPGNDDDANTIPEILAVNLADPSLSVGWQKKAPHHKRFLCDSVLLPDGKVLVTNGAEKGQADHNKHAVMKIEVFDPQDETWTVTDELDRPRLYHSTAVLLADGRVLVAGSTGHDFFRAIFNPEQHFEQEIEFVSPPYLQNETRPQIKNSPRFVPYDSPFDVSVDGPDIARVSLVRLSSTTHNNNMDQRCLFLKVLNKSEGIITVQSPKDGSWAPPGYYMLFAVDSIGTPSVGKFVQLS